MRCLKRVLTALLISGAMIAPAVPAALGADIGAIGTGNWEDASTWTGGVVPGASDNVLIGTTALGPSAAATATVTLTADESANIVVLGQESGTDGGLNLAGHALTVADTLYFGYGGSWSFQEGTGGSFTAKTGYFDGGSSFVLGTDDSMSNLYLKGGSNVTTAATGNATGDATASSGSTLTAGADLNLTQTLNVMDSGSVLNMQGHAINAANVYFGAAGTSAVTLQNLGNITTGDLFLGNGQNFTFDSNGTTDVASRLSLGDGATVTTAAVGDITVNAIVSGGAKLTLGADLSLAGPIYVQDAGSVLNAQGHAVTVVSMGIGHAGTAAVTVQDLGKVTLDNLYVGNSTVGSDLTLHGGDVINDLIQLNNGSVLTVDELGDIGLTFNGTTLDDLAIDSKSSMVLDFTGASGWDFRWADPASGGNWVSTLESMIADGQIKIDMPAGYSYSVYNDAQDGYTYIGVKGAAVPEPSSLVLALLGMASMGLGARFARSGK